MNIFVTRTIPNMKKKTKQNTILNIYTSPRPPQQHNIQIVWLIAGHLSLVLKELVLLLGEGLLSLILNIFCFNID